MYKDYKINIYSRVSTYISYLILGLLWSAWATLIPFTKERLELNESQLGSLLMLISIGAILAMSITGKIVARLGCRNVITLSFVATTFVLCIISFINDTILLSLILVMLGVWLGSADVAMNIQAVFVQNALKKKLMSGFHSMYSMGSFVGGISLSLLLSKIGMNAESVILSVSGSVIVLVCLAFRGFIPFGKEQNQEILIDSKMDSKTFDNATNNANNANSLANENLHHDKKKKRLSKPNSFIIMLGLFCFVAYMVDGAFLDWSAVFMVEVKKIPKEDSLYGFSLFFGALTFGRLLGDYFAARFSNTKLIAISSAIGICGILLLLHSDSLVLTYCGFIIAGLGAANLVPLIFSEIPAKKGEMSLHSAIAMVTTIGYSGVLLGPAMIGYISHATNLITAFYVLIALLVLVALFAKKLES